MIRLSTLLAVGVLTAACAGAPPESRVDIGDVAPTPAPAVGRGAAAGSYTVDCGREGHRNSDNLVASPGVRDGAHHLHDYVGNESTDAFSTNASLAAAPTSCRDGDASTYYWPVLRLGGHHDSPRTPDSVRITFLGSPVSEVVGMPRFLRTVTGDAKAGPGARATWTCAGFDDRRTTSYPRCPSGSRTLRVFDFPSCWDGRSTDSPDHKAHLRFPSADGSCPHGSFPVPRLRIEVGYDLAPDALFSIDSFPEVADRASASDHAHFVNVRTDKAMDEVVTCVNQGRVC
ncbi:DUF1996 domain-containing protein [Actinokineospora sp. NBRC 105648]|uniref:DUF1996 domain-containing protein n=1 Tax=Actinokineospora sp. NBRC 105648 TaxID=3032206 RepID=UPI0024A1A23B|nr:DUF1996 domain-containing protein [Actinokineospora sp. NBRC 105648]GLZ38687.1 hypothetical protein Acsp05_23110 [Actinokineospora sp. NBRC 105648]